MKGIPNVRSLKSDDLLTLFEVIQGMLDENAKDPNIEKSLSMKHKILKDCEKILMLATSNLETIYMVPFSIHSEDSTIAKINESFKDEDRINARLVVDLYLELFEDEPAVFAKESTKAYNFAPLSSLMAGTLKNLSNKQVL